MSRSTAKNAAKGKGAAVAIEVSLYWGLRTDWRAATLLKRAAAFAAAAEGFRRGSLSIAVVGARRMARLHVEHMNVSGPTDVLTFDFGTDVRTRRIDGEIIVCADIALQRARHVASAARAELALYVIHGTLHLAAYDDHNSEGYRRMHAREDELLDELGLGRVFERGHRQ